ncbi:MAG TPA: hypothetical protein PLD10_19550 [Rhodopila sp.]|nr:hypothetical protein [Rhodopila sp.]
MPAKISVLRQGGFGNQQEVVRSVASLPFPMPRSATDLFRILAHYDPVKGLDGLLERIEVDDAIPADFITLVLNRFPGNGTEAVAGPDFDCRGFFKSVLLADGFRRTIVGKFLNAFPHLKRDIFIHVPKCAGTDLILNLAQRHLPLPITLGLPDWVSKEDFLSVVSGLSRVAPFHERVFVYGHIELGEYIDLAGLRPTDHLFTIIRDPIDLMVSQANYAIGRLRQDPLGNDPDAAMTLRFLDLPRLPESIDDRGLKDLTLRALLHPQIAAPNRACTYLGRGNSGLYDVALDCLVRYNVEITTTQHYRKWLRQAWDIDASTRHNASDPILTASEVRHFYASALRDSVQEDQKLFDTITWALAKTGGTSITGQELGRLAGHSELRTLFEVARREAHSEQPDEADGADWSTRNLRVAHQEEYVQRYLQDTTVRIAGTPTYHTALALDFGADEEVKQYRLNGWSNPEPRFTWTSALESQLRLPSLSPERTYLLRLVCNPFVVPGLLPVQRIELLVNDTPMGSANCSEPAVIECEISGGILKPEQPVIVTLKVPNAARPSDLGRSDDARLLGFALRKVMIIEVQKAV